MAPISAVIRTAIAVAWIGVTVAWIGVTVSGIAPIIAGISRIRVPWVTGTDVDAHALGGCFERHTHRQAKSNALTKMADDFLIALVPLKDGCGSKRAAARISLVTILKQTLGTRF